MLPAQESPPVVGMLPAVCRVSTLCSVQAAFISQACVLATCRGRAVQWTVLKGIGDWADPRKSDNFQGLAVFNAIDALRFVLSAPDAVRVPVQGQ